MSRRGRGPADVPGGVGAGSLLGGRYRLARRLGAGGYGQVYAAEDRGDGNPVAVKVLTLRAEWDGAEREERRSRFHREALSTSSLSHPNVATIHDAGEHQGLPFLVMELLDGRDFGDVLLRRGGLPVADVLDYGAQIAAGLAHAHEHGLVHRDIKPENLMLLPGGAVKICDFGLAAPREAVPAAHTGPEAVLGSPPYMSPEQARGSEVGVWSDLYSLGCVLYALLAEGPPFSSTSAAGYAYAHACTAPEPVERRRPEVPDGLAWLLRDLLAKDPGDRPATAGEVARLLRELQTAVPWQHTAAALDRAERHAAWVLLEEGEELLAAERFADAERRFRQALDHLGRLDASTDPASFAARFGRTRALAGLSGASSVSALSTELARDAAASLGSEHPLARCVASYAAITAAGRW